MKDKCPEFTMIMYRIMVALFVIFCVLFAIPNITMAADSTSYSMPLDVLSMGGARPISPSFDHPRTSVGEPFGEASRSPNFTLRTSGYILQVETRYPYQPTGGEEYIDVQGTIDDNSATVTVEADNTVGATVESGTFTARDIFLHEGSNTIRVTACDPLNNCVETYTTVTLDTIPPAKPILNAVTSPTGLATQGLSGLKEANTAIWINGVEAIPNNPNMSWSYTVSLVEGHNLIEIFAVDLAGNLSTSRSTDIILDQIPPDMAITAPLDGFKTNTTSMTVSGTVDDPDAVVVVNAGNSVTATVSAGTFTASGVQLSIEGINMVTAQAISPMNLVDSHQIIVIRDTIPPSPPVIDPVVSPTGNPTQTITGTKEGGSNILRGGVVVVPYDGLATWSDTVTLVAGLNTFVYTSKDDVGNESTASTATIFYDDTPPDTPIVTDDGAYTTDLTRLHASWTYSPAGATIVDFKVAIGTAPQGEDIVLYTSVGLVTEVTRTGLTLVHGQTYYFSVKAINDGGAESNVGVSDGIIANANEPVIGSVDPLDGSIYYEQDPVTITVTAQDTDGDSLEYQYTVDGILRQGWTVSSTYALVQEDKNYGERIVDVAVRDGNGASVSSQTKIFFMKKPKEPPAR